MSRCIARRSGSTGRFGKAGARLLTATLAVSVLALWPAAAPAVSLRPGDVLATDRNVAAVYLLDQATGTRTTVSQGGLLRSPMGIAVTAGGDVFVGDVADDGTGVIIQIDPVTGAQSVAVQGLPFAPASIAIEADGDLVISDGLFGVPIVLRVDPRTGGRTTLSSGGLLFDPFGVAVEPGGDIIVGDVDAFGFEGAVFRIDPITGAQTTVSRDGAFVDPGAVAVEASGAIVVADRAAGPGFLGAVIRVDPASGGQTVLSQDLNLMVPIAVAIAADGGILVVNGPDPPFFSGAVIRVDPVTGVQTTVLPGLRGQGTSGIAVVPTPRAITKDDCKKGGWRALGFKNQGQCVHHVARGGPPHDTS